MTWMSSATSPVPGPGSVRAPSSADQLDRWRVDALALVEQVDVARRERVERDDRDRLILAAQPGGVERLDLVGARDRRRQQAICADTGGEDAAERGLDQRLRVETEDRRHVAR